MSNSSLQIHFDGDIADNHQVSLRTLGNKGIRGRYPFSLNTRKYKI